MTYHIVYDVLDDSAFAGRGQGLILVAFALVWTVLWVVIHRYARGMPAERRANWRAGAVIGGAFLVIGMIVARSETYPAYVDQSRCRQWARDGDHQAVEGTITSFRRGPGKNAECQFRVGRDQFGYRYRPPLTGGFRGFFTAGEARELTLRDGLAVRIAHREGRILRIEVGR